MENIQSCRVITMASGHQMNEYAYNSRSDYFSSLLEKQGALVTNKSKPEINSDYDYGYLIENMPTISKELHTDFSRAGVVATMFPLSGSSAIIRLRSRNY